MDQVEQIGPICNFFRIFSHTARHLKALKKGFHMRPRSSPNSSWLLSYRLLSALGSFTVEEIIGPVEILL